MSPDLFLTLSRKSRIQSFVPQCHQLSRNHILLCKKRNGYEEMARSVPPTCFWQDVSWGWPGAAPQCQEHHQLPSELQRPYLLEGVTIGELFKQLQHFRSSCSSVLQNGFHALRTNHPVPVSLGLRREAGAALPVEKAEK